MIIFWIIISILMFSVIVIIHEWGHFKAARIFWVKVEEFWLWIPPRAKKLFTDKKWTLFSLNWLPLGWFVKLKWETPEQFLIYNAHKKRYTNNKLSIAIKNKEKLFLKDGSQIWTTLLEEVSKKLENNNSSDNLNTKPAWQQAIIMLAGIFMNFVLAIVIFSILFMVWVKPIWINSKIATDNEIKLIPTYKQAVESWLLEKNPWIILNPIKNSPSEKAWIKEGDIIISINNNTVQTPQDFLDILQSNTAKTISITINNDNKNIEKQIALDSDWKIGAYISDNIIYNKSFEYKYGFFESIKYWFFETKNQIVLTFQGLVTLLQKIISPETPQERKDAINQVSGPIWIVDFISSSISAWVIFLLIIAAIISINLWVFNLLPIPALDGWRFLFILINSLSTSIFKKKILAEHIEAIIHVLFFIILIALSFIIAYNDISKIISN